MHGTISCLSRLALRYLPLNRRTHAQQTRHSASAFTILFPPLCAPPFVTLLLDNASTSSNHTVAQCSGNSGRVSVERPLKHQRNPQINCRDKPHKNLYPTNHTEHRDKNHHANYENVQASCSRVSGQLPSQCSYRRFFMFLRPYRCEPQSRIHRDVTRNHIDQEEAIQHNHNYIVRACVPRLLYQLAFLPHSASHP